MLQLQQVTASASSTDYLTISFPVEFHGFLLNVMDIRGPLFARIRMQRSAVADYHDH